jgi:Protein of unknown function (DUF3592)
VKAQVIPTMAQMWLFIALSFSMGVFCTYIGGKGLYYAQVSKKWSSTQGTLLLSSYKPSKGRQINLLLQYTYAIGAEQYVGSSYFPDNNNLIYLREADAFQKKYKPGYKLTIHYNPKMHGESCLMNGSFSLEDISLAGFGVCCFIYWITLLREIWHK